MIEAGQRAIRLKVTDKKDDNKARVTLNTTMAKGTTKSLVVKAARIMLYKLYKRDVRRIVAKRERLEANGR
jgi:hypothetical protein